MSAMINFGFGGKSVVVTGVSSGMGKAAAARLLEEGAIVTGFDAVPCDLDLPQFFTLDLRDREAIHAAADAIEGSVDVLLNCAGVGVRPDPDEVHRGNFLGMRRFTELVLPKMSRGSAVATIASKSGLDYPKWMSEIVSLLAIGDDEEAEAWLKGFEPAQASAYGFSKACAIVYTFSRAAELAGEGIRMNCTSPGATDTGFFGGVDPKTVPAVVRSFDHFGRMATPEEQALPLLYLASDAASYVSGANLVVDGAGLGGYLTGKLDPPPVPTYENIRNAWSIGY